MKTRIPHHNRIHKQPPPPPHTHTHTLNKPQQIELLNQAENVKTPVPAVYSSYLNHFHFSLFELMLQKYAYIYGVVLFVDINLHGWGGWVGYLMYTRCVVKC